MRIRRTIIFFHEVATNSNYNLLSVIETMFADMQDYDKYLQAKSFRANGSSSNKDYVGIYIEDKDVTTTSVPVQNLMEMYGVPVCYYSNHLVEEPLGSTTGCCNVIEGDSLLSLKDIIPQRGCSYCLKSYFEEDKATRRVLENNPKLLKNLNKKVKEVLGYELTDHLNHLGNIYVVHHNEVFRHLDVNYLPNPATLCFDFKYRFPYSGNLLVRVTLYERNQQVLAEVDWQVVNGAAHVNIALPMPCSTFDIKVFNNQRELLYHQGMLTMIEQIQLFSNIQSYTLNLKGQNGTKHIPKFSGQTLMIGHSTATLKHKIEDDELTALARINEKNLNFMFFNTIDTNTSKNKGRAKSAILSILNKARTQCQICDPYFDIIGLEYLLEMRQTNVKVDVLRCEKKDSIFTAMENDSLVKLKDGIDSYNRAVQNEIIDCRAITHAEKLHDRFIIVDGHEGWMIGTSFNQIGSRATTIYKLQKDSVQKLKAHFEGWWNGTEVESLKEYHERKKKVLRRLSKYKYILKAIFWAVKQLNDWRDKIYKKK